MNCGTILPLRASITISSTAMCCELLLCGNWLGNPQDVKSVIGDVLNV